MNDLDQLRAVICGVGIVGQIDGHDVIRRNSVIELIDRLREAEMPARPQHLRMPRNAGRISVSVKLK